MSDDDSFEILDFPDKENVEVENRVVTSKSASKMVGASTSILGEKKEQVKTSKAQAEDVGTSKKKAKKVGVPTSSDNVVKVSEAAKVSIQKVKTSKPPVNDVGTFEKKTKKVVKVLEDVESSTERTIADIVKASRATMKDAEELRMQLNEQFLKASEARKKARDERLLQLEEEQKILERELQELDARYEDVRTRPIIEYVPPPHHDFKAPESATTKKVVAPTSSEIVVKNSEALSEEQKIADIFKRLYPAKTPAEDIGSSNSETKVVNAPEAAKTSKMAAPTSSEIVVRDCDVAKSLKETEKKVKASVNDVGISEKKTKKVVKDSEDVKSSTNRTIADFVKASEARSKARDERLLRLEEEQKILERELQELDARYEEVRTRPMIEFVRPPVSDSRAPEAAGTKKVVAPTSSDIVVTEKNVKASVNDIGSSEKKKKKVVVDVIKVSEEVKASAEKVKMSNAPVEDVKTRPIIKFVRPPHHDFRAPEAATTSGEILVRDCCVGETWEETEGDYSFEAVPEESEVRASKAPVVVKASEDVESSSEGVKLVNDVETFEKKIKKVAKASEDVKSSTKQMIADFVKASEARGKARDERILQLEEQQKMLERELQEIDASLAPLEDVKTRPVIEFVPPPRHDFKAPEAAGTSEAAPKAKAEVLGSSKKKTKKVEAPVNGVGSSQKKTKKVVAEPSAEQVKTSKTTTEAAETSTTPANNSGAPKVNDDELRKLADMYYKLIRETLFPDEAEDVGSSKKKTKKSGFNDAEFVVLKQLLSLEEQKNKKAAKREKKKMEKKEAAFDVSKSFEALNLNTESEPTTSEPSTSEAAKPKEEEVKKPKRTKQEMRALQKAADKKAKAKKAAEYEASKQLVNPITAFLEWAKTEVWKTGINPTNRQEFFAGVDNLRRILQGEWAIIARDANCEKYLAAKGIDCERVKNGFLQASRSFKFSESTLETTEYMCGEQVSRSRVTLGEALPDKMTFTTNSALFRLEWDAEKQAVKLVETVNLDKDQNLIVFTQEKGVVCTRIYKKIDRPYVMTVLNALVEKVKARVDVDKIIEELPPLFHQISRVLGMRTDDDEFLELMEELHEEIAKYRDQN